MLFGISVYCFHDDDSQTEPVSAMVEKVAAAGLPYETHAMQTVVEGNWDRVMPVLKEAYEDLRQRYDRVYLSLTLDDHGGREDRLQGSVESVEEELDHPVGR